MNKEMLIQAGLTAEQADNVMKMHAQALDGKYVSKEVFNAELEKVKVASETIKERDNQIAELGKFKGTADDLAVKVAKLEQDNIVSRAEADKRLEQVMQDNELKFALTGKVLDVDDAIGKLDKGKLVFKDGKLIAGLDEQLVELKKSKPHWFPKDEETAENGLPPGWLIGNTPKESGDHDGRQGKDDPGAFGRELAKQQLEAGTESKKASDYYFKQS